MGVVRGVALGAAAVLVALVLVLVGRTLALGGRGADYPAPQVAAVPVDYAAAAGRLGAAVRIATVSHEDPRQDDPAQWETLHRWLAATYPRFHAVARRDVIAGRTLVWTWRGSDPSLKSVVLMAHQDVVPVAPETLALWLHPPFSGEVADGAVWGRGSVDDKGSLVGLMEAAEALAAQGFHPRRTIMILSGHDEEVAGTGAAAAAAWMAGQHVRAQFVLDEGSAVVTDNPVTHGPTALIGTAEKGFATLRITARAAGGHSSAPPATTAATTLARAVVAVADRPHPLRYGGPAADMLRALAPQLPFGARLAVANAWLFAPALKAQFAATPQGAAMLHTTLAPTMLQGSPKENVLPDVATAKINYRILPGDSPAGVLARARAAVGALPVELALEPGARPASPVSSTTSDSYRLLAGLVRQSSGAPVAPALVIAATDSRSLSGVADDVYRLQPLRFALRDTEMIHGVNEHLTLDNLRRMIDFYARLMEASAG